MKENKKFVIRLNRNLYMCLAIPYKIKSIKNQSAVVSCPECEDKGIRVDLVEDLKEGDFVLVQNNMAVRKIPKKKAEEIYQLITLK